MVSKKQAEKSAEDIVADRKWYEWNVQDVADTIHDSILTGFRRSFFVWGQRGIGKSSVIHQACDRAGAHLVDKRLSMMDPADIRGVLMGSQDAKTTVARWLSNPDFFPDTKGKRLVILLDEFNHAPDLIQKAAYEVAWDHSIGGMLLPEGTQVIMAGNRETENANVTPLDKPMRRRVIHIYTYFDYPTWYKWAETRLHPMPLAFCKERGAAVVNAPIDNDLVEAYGEPLPSSWEVISDIERTFTRNIDKLVAGSVGPGMATEYIAWRETAGKLTPLIDSIVAGKNDVAEDMSQQFFVCQSLAERFRRDRKLSTRILDYAVAIAHDFAEIGGVMISTARAVDWDALRSNETVYKRTMKSYYKILA